MKYMLFLFEDEDKFDSLPEQEQGKIIGEYMDYSAALAKVGAMVGGNPLEHSRTSRRIRLANGAPRVEDGPFTDSKEQLGGYYIIEAANLDEALEWAARCPAAHYGSIEVRPVWEM
jgi:hypothetical protein